MTPVLLWLVRLLVLILIVRFLMRSVTALTSGRRTASRPVAPGPERLGGTLVRDPHCGTYVPQANAITVGSGNNVQHFCSTTCRDAWLAADGRARLKA